MGAHPSHLDICCSRQLHNHTSCRPNLSDKLFCLADLVHTRCSTCLRDTTRDWAQPIFLTPPPKRLAQPTKSRLSWLLLDLRHSLALLQFPTQATDAYTTCHRAYLERRLGVTATCMHPRLLTYSSLDCRTAASNYDLRLQSPAP